MLQEKQEKTAFEAMDEYERIEAACERLQSLREKYSLEKTDGARDSSREFSKDVAALLQETKELEELPEKLEENLDTSSWASLSVTQLAEKIDVLVNKVITLEKAVSSQTVLVNTLRAENDDLNTQIRSLEEENESLGRDTPGLSSKLRKGPLASRGRTREANELDGKHVAIDESLAHSVSEYPLPRSLSSWRLRELNKVQDLNKNVESLNNTLQTNFAKAKTSIDTLAEKLTNVKLDDDLEPSPDVVKQLTDVNDNLSSNVEDGKPAEDEIPNSLKGDEEAGADDGGRATDKTYWQQILLSGIEDREKILLKEYTTILRNYKEVKKRLNEVEMKERDSHFDTTIQMRELRKAISRRDQEITNLRIRLNEDISEYDKEEEGAGSPSLTLVEEKLRADIDAILDENLDFWFRFSTAFHQIQKFKTQVRDLDEEMLKLRERRKTDGTQ
ncbi:hypothetical protein SASPL_141368 [Salvia splendens]|uniref:Uncharacterized protein n=1 Tax=Salvia splendens TaxID=180675 RepID=A0A8X8ZCS9_SALSN|nr:hypothetical protein SASPL_141368 [Salvia splendens]